MDAGTLLGPLTTVWTAPASCATYYPQCSTCIGGWFAQRCLSADGDRTAHVEDDPSCWPPRTTGVPDQTWPFGGWGFYSPGLECPAGYTSACQAVHGGKSDWEIQFTLRPQETAVGCCPEGYSCTAAPTNTCVATASTKTVVPISYCSGNAQGAMTAKTFPDVVTVTTTNSLRNPLTGVGTRTMTMYAPMFQLNFQSTDLATGSTAASSTAAVTSETSSVSSTPTNEPTSEGGLSDGAKIGIGVGVGVGGLALIGLISLLLVARRRKRKQPPAAELGGSPAGYAPVATAEHKPGSTPGHQSVFSELSGDTEPTELPAHTYR